MATHQGPPVSAGLLGWIAAAATPGDYDTNQTVLAALVSMGAISQSQADAIWNGQLSLDDLPVNMTMINEALSETGQVGAPTVLPLPSSTGPSLNPLAPGSTPAQVVPYTPAGAPPAASYANVPAGTQLVYSATWPTQIHAPANAQVVGWTVGTAVQSIATQLAAQGIVIDSSSGFGGTFSTSSGYGLTLNVHTTAAFGQLSDVKAIIDHWIYANISGMLPQSTISSAALGSPLPQPPGTITSWAEQNAVWIALVVLAAVTLPVLARRL